MNDDDHYIAGAHGTIAEQQDEAYYDDRSDADDDMEKGRIRFPRHILYGRDRELETLRNIFHDRDGLAIAEEVRDRDENGSATDLAEGDEETLPTPSACADAGSRVVFLSGYSGIGKSALVKEFVKQIRGKHASSASASDGSPIFYASGKYTEQSTASAPFSAISEMLGRLVLDLCGTNGEKENASASSSNNNKVLSNVSSNIRASELIRPGADGNRVLRATFTSISPLLDKCCDDESPKRGSTSAIHPSMNAIKECTHEILSVICKAIDHPLVLFLDDLQWGDGASIEMLSFLLSSTKLRKIMFVCAYRSNEVDADHAFTKLMESVMKARNGDNEDAAHAQPVKRMDLFSLSPEAITQFIADSINKEEPDEVAELAEAVYTKTMGNIFFVMQALEELVRKNILFYDVMCFEWRWVVSKVELGNYMSDDVVETVKGKIRELSVNVQNLLVAMAYIPNTLDVPILTALMNHGECSFEESTISNLLKEASRESMLIFSTESQNYIFAHDRIRQASLEFAAKENQDQLMLHISRVLLDFANGGDNMEWCLYVAVDLQNSLLSNTTNWPELIVLNLRVAKIAKSRGSIGKENELLHKAMLFLESSGIMWKHYGISLEIYNAVIVSDYHLGSREDTKIAINKVLKNARKNDDKLLAHMHQMMCECDETSDYKQGIVDGCRILNIYGFSIPSNITKAYIMKEQMKLKIALGNRSYLRLTELPMSDEPIFEHLKQVTKYAFFTSNERLVKLLVSKAIQYALKKGMGRHLPLVISMYGSSLATNGIVKAAQELGNVAIALCGKVQDDVEITAVAQTFAHNSILPNLRPFRNSLDCLLRCQQELKLVGGLVEMTLAATGGYFYAFVATGLELGPLFESKLLLAEEYCQDLSQPGWLTIFKFLRQFALNLRTKTNNPTEFLGEAFREGEALNKMDNNARKMALRDSSSMRLQLAFVFWDEECMIEMLERLHDYPLTDASLARLHSRLCFTGLAAFALGKRKGCESFAKLGKKCLSYFAHLTKLGSVNAKPVHLFMLAVKGPSREAFKKAIDACHEASMIHLEAMAKEQYAVFLNKENDATLANDYITSSYWLYQDWGAHAKTFQLSQQYDFLMNCTRKNAKSGTLSTTPS